MQDNPLWYKDAILYELYIRAFYDSNGDGHGDLPGVIAKLDYLKDLGVDCIWLLPIYPSPLRDDGYDIADYYGVISEYGKTDDFRALIEEAHARGIRIIADLVLNHTSDQHPWFQKARSDPNSPYRDYYVWSDTARNTGIPASSFWTPRILTGLGMRKPASTSGIASTRHSRISIMITPRCARR